MYTSGTHTSADFAVGARGDVVHHLHSDCSAAEHEAEPSEDAVGNSTGLLVHAEAQYHKKDADEHQRYGDVALGLEGCSEQRQQRKDGSPMAKEHVI